MKQLTSVAVALAQRPLDEAVGGRCYRLGMEDLGEAQSFGLWDVVISGERGLNTVNVYNL